MRIYKADNPQPVNSSARAAQRIVIPPFNLRGPMQEQTSDQWYPEYSFRLLGGYVKLTSAGEDSVEFTVYKNNIFETDGSFYPPAEAATALLSATDTKQLFVLADPLTGATSFSQYDWITVYCDNASGHSGAVIQLYAERVN